MKTNTKRGYIDKEKVRMVLDYAKTMIEHFRKGIYDFNVSPAYATFSYAVNLYGYSAFPQVVSDEEYEKLNTPEQYRGAADPEYNANLLCDYDYHYGDGLEGFGIYSTPNRELAAAYAHPSCSGDTKEENIMRFKLASDVRFFKNSATSFHPYSVIERLKNPDIQEFLNLLKEIDPKETRQMVRNVVMQDIALIALLLGYDASNHTHVQIYNRSKMVVCESEFKRVCSLSRKYQGGVIDFEQKYAHPEEFLCE